MKPILVRAVEYAKLAVLFAALASIGILMGEKGLMEKRRLEEKQTMLQQENRRLTQEIKELERQITLLRTDPHTIEKVAKRELGMARPDEMVYVFERSMLHVRPPGKPLGLKNRDNIP